MTRIAYVAQRGHTGARAQAEVLIGHFDDVELVYGNPLGIESPERPYERHDGAVYPTADLAKALAALDVDVVLVHIFNAGTVQALAPVSTFATTVLRAGINPTENMMTKGGNAGAFAPVVQVIQAFDHVVAPSAGTARDLRCMGVEAERVTVIPTALPMDSLEPPDPNRPQTFGCLAGRLTPLKNQHTLILALAGLLDLEPSLPARLVLAGGAQGNHLDVIQGLAGAIGVAGRTDFLGFVDPETGYFPNVGVNCLPSFSERMPQAVLEAARAGVPSIVADAAWAESFDSMPTVAPDDPLAWAEALAELLTNDARRVQLAQAQQEEVYGRFDVEDVIGQYEALFDDLLATTRRFKIPGEVVV